jgi:hypothetical protein
MVEAEIACDNPAKRVFADLFPVRAAITLHSEHDEGGSEFEHPETFRGSIWLADQVFE